MEEKRTIATDELLFAQLNNRDWEAFWLRLMARCAWILRKRYNVRWPNDELKIFSRNTISEIISKIFIEKKRRWNIDAYPDFEDFIIGVVDSNINNTLNKSSKEVELDEDLQVLTGNVIAISVEQIIIGKELESEIYKELRASGATDDELLIFECLADGIIKPDDIRSTIGLSEEEFHNTWRRFKRKREAIKEKLAAHGY